MASFRCFHGFIRWGDNFASTLREPAEPTIDSEDFDERLQAAVDQRQVGTPTFQPFLLGDPVQGVGGSNKPHKGWAWQVQVVPRIILGQEVEGNEGGIVSQWELHEASAAMQGWFFCTENCTASVLSRRRLTTGKSFMSFLDWRNLVEVHFLLFRECLPSTLWLRLDLPKILYADRRSFLYQ